MTEITMQVLLLIYFKSCKSKAVIPDVILFLSPLQYTRDRKKNLVYISMSI